MVKDRALTTFVIKNTFIKLNHFFESMDHIGLTQKLDASLRLWLNCGTVNITVANAGTPANMAYSITPANNTFF
jgi:hypothetical protein